MHPMLLSRASSLTTRSSFGRRGLASTLLARNKPTEEWSLSQLKQEAKNRGMPISGTKSALISRLRSDDSSRSQSTSSTLSTYNPTVVSPASTPVHAPAPRTVFKSHRTVKGGATIPGVKQEDNPFQPRRSAPMMINLPDQVEPVLEGPTIPVVPDNYASNPHESASPPTTVLEEPKAKVSTVSGHLDERIAAPAHPSDAIAVNPPVEISSTSSPPPSSTSSTSSVTENAQGYAQQLTSYFGTSESKTADPEAEVDPKADLSKHEKSGLYVLLGIFAGGWLLGGVAKKDGLKAHEHGQY